jgi:molybdopterin molybdotransferase
VADFALERRAGRCEFHPAVFTGRDGPGRQGVRLLSASWSARIAMLAEADGLALVPGETTAVRPGDLLEVIPFGTGHPA